MSFSPLRTPPVQRPISALMRAVSWPAITLTRSIQDLRVTGQHHIPDSGPIIFVVNHTSHLDALIIGVALYEAGIPPYFAAKKELYDGPLGPLLRRLGQISVDRDNPVDTLQSLAAVLDRGQCVVIFPEGTFTHDRAGWPMRAKTGIARLHQLRPNVPIVPIAHWGSERLIHQWTGRVNFSRILHRSETVYVHFGSPVELTGESLKEQANSVMHVIAKDVARLRRKLGRDMGDPPETLFVPDRLDYLEKREVQPVSKLKRCGSAIKHYLRR